jgi:enoyl-CoA hydratase/carnithine racemase
MPFKYIIKWQKTNPEKISVEAFHRYPHTEEEKHKPAFTIGKAQGGGLLAIRHVLEKAAQKYPTKKRGKTTYILLNEGDETAYETAYRIGLATAMINKAQTTQEIQKTTHYILNATPEEIWFWTSKLLDDEINTKALEALAVLSGATQTNQTTPTTKQTPPKPIQPQKGTFWPIVRQRMKEKAIQLYKKDHPQTETAPSLKELRKAGYLQIAKTITLKEVYQEKKNSKIPANHS